MMSRVSKEGVKVKNTNGPSGFPCSKIAEDNKGFSVSETEVFLQRQAKEVDHKQ